MGRCWKMRRWTKEEDKLVLSQEEEDWRLGIRINRTVFAIHKRRERLKTQGKRSHLMEHFEIKLYAIEESMKLDKSSNK